MITLPIVLYILCYLLTDANDDSNTSYFKIKTKDLLQTIKNFANKIKIFKKFKSICEITLNHMRNEGRIFFFDNNYYESRTINRIR
jgi:hypothetical protein